MHIQLVLCTIVILFVANSNQALLCDANNFSPRITCPAAVSLDADPVTCQATGTWETFQYYPSPFYSTGVTDTPQKTKLPTDSYDPHYFYPDYYLEPALVADNDFPSAECKPLGASDGLLGKV